MSGHFATSLVQFCQSSGLEMNVHFFLEEKPTRQEQKLNTLSKYVQKYPQGWKKKLERLYRTYYVKKLIIFIKINYEI